MADSVGVLPLLWHYFMDVNQEKDFELCFKSQPNSRNINELKRKIRIVLDFLSMLFFSPVNVHFNLFP